MKLPMKLTNLIIKDLFTDGTKLTFLIGAGCSVDPPSCLPAGHPMMKAMINYTCAESEREKILKLKELRFEQLVEIIRGSLDHELKIIDYYGQCDKPNLQHFFLAAMIKKGHFVMTTNFDFLIEYALLQSGVPKNEIIPIITKQDFEIYNNPNELLNEGKKTIYKIHGSTKNIITELDTRDSLVATIQALGSGKEDENVFQVEPFKRLVFDNISSNRTFIIIGYSGSDDFDIIPTLKVLKNLKNIVWINYIQDDGGIEKIYEINETDFEKIKSSGKVNQILFDIYRMHNANHVYRVDANTRNLISRITDIKLNTSLEPFSITPMDWFEDNIKPSSQILQYFIPFKIYYDFHKYKDAMRCIKKILHIAEKRGDQSWKSTALNNIGRILKVKGELDESLRCYRESLTIAEQLGDLRGKAIRLNNIGCVIEDQGKLYEALTNYQEALAIAEQLGDLRVKIATLNNIGRIMKDQGELDKLLTHYQEALTITEQLGDLRLKADSFNNLGTILHGKGKVGEALMYFRNSLEINEQIGDLRNKATNFNNIG